MKHSSHHNLRGIPVSPGIGHGPAHIHDVRRHSVERREIPADEVEAEVARFDKAVEETREQLLHIEKMVTSKIDKAHAAIFDAQSVLLDDPLLTEACRRDIRAQKLNAEFILGQIVAQIRTLFEEIEVPHLSAQNLDVLDVAARIRENLSPSIRNTIQKLTHKSVIVAHDLRPSDTARLDADRVLGIVTEAGGPTSHSAILAKALDIPAVVGVEGLMEHVRQGDSLIVDGQTGTVTIQPTPTDMGRLTKRRRLLRQERDSWEKLRDLPCETRDGYAVEIGANLEIPAEVRGVAASGAQGIGLFRSEFFYIGHGSIPSEEEQFEVYRDVIEHVAPLPVICRTLDIGGDKFMSQPGMDGDEMNPFLGLRAIRLCLARPEMFRTQLRAILRASAFGNVRIMFPFITDVSEVRRAKDILRQAQRELKHLGTPFDANVLIGIMIETPSAALTAQTLAAEVDFFSIGTNDLIQYTMAVDRVNESVADLYNPLHPAVIHLIRHTIDTGHRVGTWVGLCGEMAADPVLSVLLVGLGIDELSMSAVAIPEVKRLIRSLELEDIRQLRQDVLASLEAGQARKVIDRFRRKHMKGLARGV
jgi:phosphoenolpyruvate-protein phosphotransferase (PTS system enzyme I)